MGAPQKTTGGRKSKTAKPGGEIHPSEGRISPTSAAAPARRSRGSARAEAIRSKAPKRAKGKRKAKPPRHDTASSARPRILAAARKMAAKRGYSQLRLLDITTEAEITHQGFYGHFANKRHAVAVATSDELGAIADLAMRGSQRDQGWAERLLADIDKALVEAYPSSDGPERWLRDRFLSAFATEGGYSALRINELIKISKLGHGEFYRRYGGKLGCLRRIYSDVLAELHCELLEGEGQSPPISRVGEAFGSDPNRSRFLILGASHLPDADTEQAEEDAATQGSLQILLTEAAAASAPQTSPEVHAATAGGVLEVIRSAVLAGRVGRIDSELRMLGRAWAVRPSDRGGSLAEAA